jgi:hypothetical protein
MSAMTEAIWAALAELGDDVYDAALEEMVVPDLDDPLVE